MAKKIPVLPASGSDPEVALEFTARGPGQETPYWQGVIHAKVGRKWTAVGHFYNSGTGGATLVQGVGDVGSAVVTRLETAVQDAHAVHDCHTVEPLGDAVEYAEAIGYQLRCRMDEFSLTDYVGWTRLPPEAPGHTAGRMKALRVLGAQYATKNKTAVDVGSDDLVIFATRDHAAVRRAMDKRGTPYVILG